MQIKSVSLVLRKKIESEINSQPPDEKPRKIKRGGWDNIGFSSSCVFEAEERFVLIDCATKEILKRKVMKQSEADERNKIISDINYAWVKAL
ncbi:MAG: hypothetical protein WCJ74_02630 [bacterium]